MTRGKCSGAGSNLAMVGVVGLAVLCCAGPVVLATLGVGTVLAAFTSWWVLLPAGLAAAGIVGWYAWRRSCRIRDRKAAPLNSHQTTPERTPSEQTEHHEKTEEAVSET